MSKHDPKTVREKECKRWHMRRSQKKVKCISYVTEQMKRNVRRRWRKQKAKYRARVKSTQACTPPPSEVHSEDGRTKHGRATLAYNKTKAYRCIVSLTTSLQSEKTAKAKYKKRWLRLKMSMSNCCASTIPSVSSHRAVSTTSACMAPE